MPLKQEAIIEYRVGSSEIIDKNKSLFTKRSRLKPVWTKYARFTDNEIVAEENCLNILFLLRKQSASYKTKHNNFALNRISSDSISDFIVIVPGLG